MLSAVRCPPSMCHASVKRYPIAADNHEFMRRHASASCHHIPPSAKRVRRELSVRHDLMRRPASFMRLMNPALSPFDVQSRASVDRRTIYESRHGGIAETKRKRKQKRT